MKNTRRIGVALVATAVLTASGIAAQAQPLLQRVTTGAHAADSADDAPVEIKIVGGKVTDQRYPWMAYNEGCGASLIASRWIVTAAHCLRPAPDHIRLDTNNKFYDGEYIDVASSISHPNYKKIPGYDIGLVELKTAAKATPIPIAASAGPAGTRTRILGWGSERPDGEGSSQLLKELDTSVLPATRCTDVDGVFNKTKEICTDSPNGTGACFGDSGGPQVRSVNGRWELIGATSRGADVCASLPSIYTNVSAHMKWINEMTRGAVPIPNGWVDPGPDDIPSTPKPTATATPTPTNSTPPPTNSTPTPTPTNEPTNSPTNNPGPTNPQPGQDTFSDNATQPINDMQSVRSVLKSTYANARSVKITINVDHGCAQNLGIAITTPDGVRSQVKRATYASRCAPWNGPRTETYPLNSASAGDWILEVSDEYRGNTGTFKGWSISFS